MLQIVNKYVNYVEHLKEYVNNSPYKTSYIYEKIGMNKQNFYRKMRNNSFTPKEVLSISKILFPDEALLLELQKSQKDKENGRVMEYSKGIEILKKKHL